MCIAALNAAAPTQTHCGRSPLTTTHTTPTGRHRAALSTAYVQMNSNRSSVTPFAARFHNACSTAAVNTSASAPGPTPAGCHNHGFVCGLLRLLRRGERRPNRG